MKSLLYFLQCSRSVTSQPPNTQLNFLASHHSFVLAPYKSNLVDTMGGTRMTPCLREAHTLWGQSGIKLVFVIQCRICVTSWAAWACPHTQANRERGELLAKCFAKGFTANLLHSWNLKLCLDPQPSFFSILTHFTVILFFIFEPLKKRETKSMFAHWCTDVIRWRLVGMPINF